MTALDITILSPGNASVRSAPGGLGYLAEMYAAGGMQDDLSVRQTQDGWLFESLDRLRARYGEQINVRWISPFSLLGLFLAFRFRIRSYPYIILGGDVLGPIEDPGDFERSVAERLADARS